MKVEHIAIWVSDLEASKHFYTHYFGMKANTKYENPKKEFASYFLSLQDGARLELMHRPQLAAKEMNNHQVGFAHMALSLGSKDEVDHLTNRLRNDGFTIQGEPRMTGDGYFESIVLDPDGNWVEISE